MSHAVQITSLQNARVKEAIRLNRRSHRDEAGLLLIEGYREVKRALDNGIRPLSLFFAPDWFLGGNEPALVERCGAAGAELLECSREVFARLAYRDRPEGLLAVAPQMRGFNAPKSLAPVTMPHSTFSDPNKQKFGH